MAMAPEQPLVTWFRELDGLIEGSPGFFAGRPIILDAAKMPRHSQALRTVIADLAERGIRVMALEGADGMEVTPDLPPTVNGTRDTSVKEMSSEAARSPTGSKSSSPGSDVLLVDHPVRSGQTIFHSGDVTIIGSVSSGAEVIAGGSIHVYGALRGRAMAGSIGTSDARIFCNKLEAELIAINGLYQTADEMPTRLRGRAIQAWLQDEAISMAELN
jgi:septum site-determining protein MinC